MGLGNVVTAIVWTGIKCTSGIGAFMKCSHLNRTRICCYSNFVGRDKMYQWDRRIHDMFTPLPSILFLNSRLIILPISQFCLFNSLVQSGTAVQIFNVLTINLGSVPGTAAQIFNVATLI